MRLVLQDFYFGGFVFFSNLYFAPGPSMQKLFCGTPGSPMKSQERAGLYRRLQGLSPLTLQVNCLRKARLFTLPEEGEFCFVYHAPMYLFFHCLDADTCDDGRQQTTHQTEKHS